MTQVKLRMPTQGVDYYRHYTYLKQYLRKGGFAHRFEWIDPGSWYPDFVWVDSDTAIMLALISGMVPAE